MVCRFQSIQNEQNRLKTAVFLLPDSRPCGILYEEVYEDSDTGIIRGMMGIGMSEDDDKKGAFELHFLYVDPDYLRMGIGSEMLQFYEQKGKEKGCTEFVVWVLEENGIGISFYEKNGYHPDGKVKVFKRWNKREIRYIKLIPYELTADGKY